MAARRRTQFKGVDPLAVRELVGIQADLSGDTDQLRSDALGNTTDTKTASGYHAGYNQRVRVKMPAGGGTLSFPPANSASQNKWIEVIHTGGGNVTIVPTGNFVQGAGTFALTAPGSYYFQSDGLNSWWVQPTGGGGLSAPVTNAQLDVMPANTVKVNATAGAATPTDLAIAVSGVLGRGAAGNIQSLTPTLLTGNVLQFTAAASGKVPLSGGGTVNFLRADGAWAAPPAGGSVPTGTGFTHITAGAQDAAAKLVDTADINALQVTNAKLAARTANSLMGEFTGAAVAPQDLAIGTESVVGRSSGTLGQFASTVQSALIRAAGSVFFASAAAGQHLRRSLAGGDLGFSALEVGALGTPIVANAAATAAITNLSCTGAQTLAAGAGVVGSTLLFAGWYVFVHTAAATPTLTAEILVNGAVVATAVLTPISTAATLAGRIDGVLTIRTTGAGGTALTQVHFDSNHAATGTVDGSVVTANFAIDTTVARTMELRVRMTTVVAANTLTVTNGYIRRIS